MTWFDIVKNNLRESHFRNVDMMDYPHLVQGLPISFPDELEEYPPASGWKKRIPREKKTLRRGLRRHQINVALWDSCLRCLEVYETLLRSKKIV
jgi:hypothetical protein